MEHAGAIIGMPFLLEGFAFFAEAIFLGLYLYGWDRLSPVAHWICGVLAAFNGALSAIFVVTANGWMNAPAGFRMVDGKPAEIDPIAAMLNAASFHETLHMTRAAFVSTGFAAAGVHAFFLLRKPGSEFHRAALGIAVGCVSAPLQILSGDFRARTVTKIQPAKLAAMEAHYHTTEGAPILLRGLPNDDTRTTKYALPIPNGPILLVAHDPHARVAGLEEFPRRDWPNVRLVHRSFDLMVGCGFALLALALTAGVLWSKRRRLPDARWFLRATVLAAPLGFVAIEAGWMVTELGRQPWIIYQVMRTSEAVTPMPGIAAPFCLHRHLYFHRPDRGLSPPPAIYPRARADRSRRRDFDPCLKTPSRFSWLAR